MKLIFITLLYLTSLVAGEDYPTYSCQLQIANTDYDLTGLFRSTGNAYAAKDENGNMIYFNLCGTLEGLAEVSLGCDPSASACLQTPSEVIINTGRPDNDIVQAGTGVEVTYYNGDSCYSENGDYISTYTTTIYLECGAPSDDGTLINFTSVNISGCNVDIYGTSPNACGITYETSISSDTVNGGPVAIILLGFILFSCACCVGVCVRSRRRCRQNRQACKQPVELNSVSYQPVAQQPQQSIQHPRPQPIPQQIPAPYVPMFPMQQPGMVPQQFQPVPPVYFHQPYFAYPPQQAFAPPLTQVNDNVIYARDNQVSDDERIARELQAKFDNE